MSNTNDDTNMTGNADNCDPLRTKSGQKFCDCVSPRTLLAARGFCYRCMLRVPPEPPAEVSRFETGKPAKPLSELAKLINSWDEYLITVEREIAERPTPDVAASIARAAADYIADQTDREMTERPTPITDAEWQTECCSGASWYCIAERMKNRAADLERQLAEVKGQRDEAHQKCREYRLVALGAEDALEKMTAQRDEAKAEMWKARNALKRVTGALRYITNDFRAFKHYARTKNNLGGSYGIYSIDRAKRALADVRKLVATWGKGGEA